MMNGVITRVLLLKLEEAYKSQENVKIKELSDRHIELTKPVSNGLRVVRYKDLYFTIGSSIDGLPINNEALHKDARDFAEEILDERDLFNYDMDRLRHYLSYIERYSSTMEEFNTYVPPALMESIVMHFTEPSKIKTKKMQNIHNLYTEEPKILKRYFLLYQLNKMKG